MNSKIISKRNGLSRRWPFVLKNVLIICIALSSVPVFADVYSQTAVLNIAVKDEPMEKVLDAIEKQSEFRFLYNKSQVDVERKVTIVASNKKVDEILAEVTKGTDISYTINNRQIVLSKKSAPISEQQTRQISGKIVDEKGEPVIGANVAVKGAGTGTISDLDGNFSLNAASGQVLSITYVGYQTREVLVTNQSVYDVIIVEDTRMLSEVIVVGYGTQQKKDITGSVAIVSTKDLLKTASPNVLQQLQGRAAGVVVGTSGSPGSASVVRIRGVGTVNDNGPLYVIDGVSTRDQNLNGLNPNDIESMQVLKDASAAAIYGAQASNGVVLITTKKGDRSGVPKLAYDAYFGASQTGKKYDLLNSGDRLAIDWAAQKSAFNIRGVTDKLPSHAQFGTGEKPSIPKYLTSGAGAQGLDVDPSLYNYPSFLMTAFDPNKGTDWWDAIDQTGFIQNHQITASGGSDKGQYLFSANYFDQQGTVKYTYYKRYSVRANTSYNIRPWLRIGQNLSYTYSKDIGLDSSSGEATPYSWAYRSSPWVPVYDIKGNFAGSKISETGNWQNIVARKYREKDNYYGNNRVFGNMWAEIDLMKELTFRTNFGVDNSSYYQYAMSKKDLEFSESGGVNGLTENAGFNFRYVWTNTLAYSKVFNQDHRLNVLLGTEAIQDGYGRSMGAYRRGYLYEDNTNTWTLNMGANDANRTNTSSYNNLYRLFGIFGRADYSYKDKYLATVILRQDGVSRFSSTNRYGVFPSLSLGWRISGEEFMKSTDNWLDDLKLRVGYGQTGNAEIPSATNFAYTFSTAPDRTNYDMTGSQMDALLGYRLATFGNPSTKWEKSEMTNIGIDATFKRGMFSVNLEGYIKNTTDMLVRAVYSGMAGEASAPFINLGNMRNIGLDFSFTYRDKRGDFSWETTLNASTYKNTVLKLGDTDEAAMYGYSDRISGAVSRTIKDRPIGEFYGYNIVGFYENVDQVEALTPLGQVKGNFDTKTWIGKYRIEDVNKDGKITAEDRTTLGSPHPLFTAGLNVGLSYKNFDFTMFWYSSVGNKIFNGAKYFTDFWMFNGNRSSRMRDLSWEPGKKDAILPILDKQDAVSGTNASSYYIEDGSFARMKTLQIGYTFPRAILKRATISNLRLYLQAENLITITGYKGIDPEVTNRSKGGGGDLEKGIDVGGIPNSMKFIFGVNFAF